MFQTRYEEKQRVLRNPAALHKNPHRARSRYSPAFGKNADQGLRSGSRVAAIARMVIRPRGREQSVGFIDCRKVHPNLENGSGSKNRKQEKNCTAILCVPSGHQARRWIIGEVTDKPRRREVRYQPAMVSHFISVN